MGIRTITIITVTTTAITTTIITITAMITTPTATVMLMTPATRKPGAGGRRASEPAPDAATVAQGGGERAALFRLMTWLSPSFPVGAFSYSSGLEWAVEAGDVVDGDTLVDWLSAMLSDGAGFCDAVFMAHAHRRASASDLTGLAEVAELAAAMVSSRERQLESTAQGRAFVEIALAAWSCEGMADAMGAIGKAPAYPVAVGVACAAHGLALPPSLHAFLHAVTANWISAAARLVPLGQTASQHALARLEPVVAATGERALGAALDDLGSVTLRADLASMRHEGQYTRLFRS
jgi:urease accessory protein